MKRFIFIFFALQWNKLVVNVTESLLLFQHTISLTTNQKHLSLVNFTQSTVGYPFFYKSIIFRNLGDFRSGNGLLKQKF